MIKKTNVFLCLLLAAVLLCSCAQPTVDVEKTPSPVPAVTPAPEATPSPQPTDHHITVPYIDMQGNTVPVTGIPQRIVSLSPTTTEILFALGVGERIVGVDKNSNYPDNTAQIDKVEDENGLNLQSILDKDPDIVFVSERHLTHDADLFAQLDVPVVCAEAASFADIYVSIGLVAQIMNVNASAVVEEMQAAVQEVVTKVGEPEGPLSVYVVLEYGEAGNYTSGPGTFINDVITMAGGLCVTDGADESWPVYSLEEVAQLNPDVLLVSSVYDVEDICNAPGYRDLPAVEQGRVYPIECDWITRPGPRIALALEEVYQALEQARIA